MIESREAMSATLHHEAALARPSLVALILMMSPAWMVGFTLTLLAPALPMIAQSLGENGTLKAQTIMIMPSIGIIFGGAITGIVLERLGPRALLIAALFCYASLGTIPLFTSHFATLLLSRFLLGVAACAVVTALTDLIARYYTGTTRDKMLGYQGAIGSALGAVSLLVAGAIASAWGWQAACLPYLAAAILILPAIFGLPRFPPLAKPAGKAEKPLSLRDRMGGVAPYWFLVIIGFSTVQFMVSIQVPFALHEDGISSPSSISYIIFTGAVATTLGAACFGYVSARLGRGGTLNLVMVLLAAGSAITGFSHDAVSTTAGCVVVAFGAGIVAPYLYALVLAEANPATRGRAVGLAQASFFLGDFANLLLPRSARSSGREAYSWWGLRSLFSR
jgi:MFS family permease